MTMSLVKSPMLGAVLLATFGTGSYAANTALAGTTELDAALENAQTLATREMKRGGYIE